MSQTLPPETTSELPSPESVRRSSRRDDRPEQPAVRIRELIALLLMVAVADVTLFRGAGFAGHAAFLIAAPLLLAVGTARKSLKSGTLPIALVLIGPMLAALAVRLAWCGSWPGVTCGFVLLVCFAMTLNGRVPYLLHAAVFAAQTIPSGHRGLNHYFRSLSRIRLRLPQHGRLAVLLPAVICSMFGLLFVLANPDLLASVSERLSFALTAANRWLVEFSPNPMEVLFWFWTAWITVGLLRLEDKQKDVDADYDYVEIESVETRPAQLYEAYRNSLIVVIGLFAAYLVFEFQTLWFREFPAGFHYSGYAHKGAAWLTVALGLATLLLSVIFRRSILQDTRLPGLRRLAWLWSFENVLLAAAVYHRLSIYVGFNGMTRMRTIALLGISSVLIGFVLVLWKIARNRDFHWLIRRQLWTVAIAVYLYVLLPVDAWVMSYNVNRILAGDPAPSVQISVHPTSAEGFLQLIPLAASGNETIREGVRAILAQRHEDYYTHKWLRAGQGWTAIQIAERQLIVQLGKAREQWAKDGDHELRSHAADRFHEYAYQWY